MDDIKKEIEILYRLAGKLNCTAAFCGLNPALVGQYLDQLKAQLARVQTLWNSGPAAPKRC